MNKSCRHSGCLGDVLAAGPIFRHLGGVHLRITQYKNPNWAITKGMRGGRYEAIRPLLEIQPYIASVAFDDSDEPADLDLENWRHEHRHNRTLTESQAAALGIHDRISMEPWIRGVNPSKESAGRIVISRTQRYLNPLFPWRRILKHNQERVLFVGLPTEHAAFCKEFGASVEYRPTKSLLEVAELIAGAAITITNQTVGAWISMGLGAPYIQETSLITQDSIVPRANAQYCIHGRLTEPPGLPFRLLSEKPLTTSSQKVMNTPAPMLCVIAFHEGDRHQAIAMACRIRDLQGVSEYDCLLIHPETVSSEGIKETLEDAFRTVKDLPYPSMLKGWPFGPNEIAATAFMYIARTPGLPKAFLWMEADCFPVNPYWLHDIDVAWQRGGQPFLGVVADSVLPQAPGHRHTVGVAVYPKDFATWCPLVRSTVAMTAEHQRQRAIPQAFDVYYGPYMAQRTTQSRLIQHFRNSRNFRREKGQIVCDSESVIMTNIVDPEAVLLHGAKDDSLFNLLGKAHQEELGIDDPPDGDLGRQTQEIMAPIIQRETPPARPVAPPPREPAHREPPRTPARTLPPTQKKAPGKPDKMAEGVSTAKGPAERLARKRKLSMAKWPKLKTYAVSLGIKCGPTLRKPEMIEQILEIEGYSATPAPAPAPVQQAVPSIPVQTPALPAWGTEKPEDTGWISDSMRQKMIALRQEREARQKGAA